MGSSCERVITGTDVSVPGCDFNTGSACYSSQICSSSIRIAVNQEGNISNISIKYRYRKRVSMSRCWRPALAYGLLVLLAACSSVHAQSSPPYIATKAHRNVCVSPFITVDECSGNGTASTFTGLEVQVSRAQSGSRAP